MKILSVVGARPNMMKIAPFIRAINLHNKISQPYIDHFLVHTGQHYDYEMSNIFFEQLNILKADRYLKIGSGTHSEQVGETMIEFEKVLELEKPDWVVLVGDVNATLACSITTKKQKIKLCHIEAGLRSNDMNMPEEVNRLVTDAISDLLLVPDKFSFRNLIREGKDKNSIKMVGNIMIDSFEQNKAHAKKIDLISIAKKNINNSNKFVDFSNSDYALITIHRPSNVDNREKLELIVNFISEYVLYNLILIWPMHPRTKKQLKEFKMWKNLLNNNRIIILNPIGYFEMLKLNLNARIVFTDSGGVQEESCVIGTPCLCLRSNTERPITLAENGGTVHLVDESLKNLKDTYKGMINNKKSPSIPEKWDGKTAARCLDEIINFAN